MAFLGTLAGGLAHEIRNPLSTMKVNLQLLREQLLVDHPDPVDAEEQRARARRRVEGLEKAVRRMEDILDDFLSFARGFELDLVPQDLNSLVDEVVTFVEPELVRVGVGLRTSFDEELPWVTVDRKYLQQVLLNLILNARQAIEESEVEDGEIFLTTRRVGTSALIHVIDTGPGIPEDVRPRIFDAFFSTKKNGTGLGLATCRRIVEEHGGRIHVATEPGKGTAFSIELPLAPELPAPDGARDSSDAPDLEGPDEAASPSSPSPTPTTT